MGILIVDAKNILSKNQKQKIKMNVTKFLVNENDDNNLQIYLEKNILSSIYYENEDNLRYNHVQFEKKNDDYILSFQIQEKPDLKKKLYEKMMIQKKLRESSDEAELWKMYSKIKERCSKPIPNPNEIQKQKTIFEEFIKQIKDPTIKTYIQKCLDRVPPHTTDF
jgi:hypothetical protein